MPPNKFVVPEVILHGYKTMKENGYIRISVTCVTLLSPSVVLPGGFQKETVPALIGIHQARENEVDHPYGYCLVTSQYIHQDGRGEAEFIITEMRSTQNSLHEIQFPKQYKNFRFEWNVPLLGHA